MKFGKKNKGDADVDDAVRRRSGDQADGRSWCKQRKSGHVSGVDAQDCIDESESAAVLTQVRAASPNTAAGNAGQQLGDVLVLRGLVTHEQVQEALELQTQSGGRLGELLVHMGVLEERDLVGALAEFFGMPVADLRRYKPDPDALALISEDVARENMAIPISLHDDGLHVAVAEPSDSLRFLLSEKSGHPVRLLLAPATDVIWAIDSNYLAIGGVAQLVQAFEVVEGSRKRVVETAQPVVVADDAPVVQVVDRILTQAMRDRTSDVHIEPSEDVVRVRFRIDGALKQILVLPAAMGLGPGQSHQDHGRDEHRRTPAPSRWSADHDGRRQRG